MGFDVTGTLNIHVARFVPLLMKNWQYDTYYLELHRLTYNNLIILGLVETARSLHQRLSGSNLRLHVDICLSLGEKKLAF